MARISEIGSSIPLAGYQAIALAASVAALVPLWSGNLSVDLHDKIEELSVRLESVFIVAATLSFSAVLVCSAPSTNTSTCNRNRSARTISQIGVVSIAVFAANLLLWILSSGLSNKGGFSAAFLSLLIFNGIFVLMSSIYSLWRARVGHALAGSLIVGVLFTTCYIRFGVSWCAAVSAILFSLFSLGFIAFSIPPVLILLSKHEMLPHRATQIFLSLCKYCCRIVWLEQHDESIDGPSVIMGCGVGSALIVAIWINVLLSTDAVDLLHNLCYLASIAVCVFDGLLLVLIGWSLQSALVAAEVCNTY